MDTYVVYIKTDENNRIIDINSSAFLTDVTGWTQIDEGSGDKFHHAQGNYFLGGLRTEGGICRWKYVDGQCILRTDDEMKSDKTPAELASEAMRNIEQRVTDCENDLDLLITGLEGLA